MSSGELWYEKKYIDQGFELKLFVAYVNHHLTKHSYIFNKSYCILLDLVIYLFFYNFL